MPLNSISQLALFAALPWALFALSLAFSTHAGAAGSVSPNNSQCLNELEVKSLQQEFSWKSQNPKYPKVEPCQVGNLTYNVAAALLFLKSLTFEESTGAPLGLNVLGTSPYSFLKLRVRKIVFKTNKDGECPVEWKDDVVRSGLVAFANRRDMSINICERAGALDPFALAAFLVHEARHLDGPAYEHVPCERGYFANAPVAACDSSLQLQGAYSVGVEYNLKLAKLPSLPEKMREFSKLRALVDLQQRFNHLPFEFSTGALLQDSAGTFWFYDGKQIQSVASGTPSDLLVRQYEIPLIYHRGQNPLQPLSVRYLFPAAISSQPSGVYDYTLKKAVKASEMSELLDVYQGASYSCYLLKTVLRCTDANETAYDLQFSKIKPKHLLSSSQDSFVKTDTVSLLTEDGAVYTLPERISGLSAIHEQDLVQEKSNPSQKRFNFLRVEAWLGGNSLVLTKNGEVKVLSASDNSLSSIPALQGRKFNDMYAPFLYSPLLRDIL